MSYVFISYSKKDKKYANNLVKEIRIQGFDVWIDDRIDYGDQWEKTIEAKLEGCGAFILIMTPDSKGSRWVKNELARAERRGKKIFPLLLQGDGPWFSIETIQFFDVRRGDLPSNEFFESLGKIIPKKVKNKKVLIKSELEVDSDVIYNIRIKKIIEALIELKDKALSSEDKKFYLEVGACEIEYKLNEKVKDPVVYQGNIYRDRENFFKTLLALGKNENLISPQTNETLIKMGWTIPKFYSKPMVLEIGSSFGKLLPIIGQKIPQPKKILVFTIKWNKNRKLHDIANFIIETNKRLSIEPSEVSVVIRENKKIRYYYRKLS